MPPHGDAPNPFAVDWEERFDPARLRRDRLANAPRELVASGLDALITWRTENVRYLASLRGQIIAQRLPPLLCDAGFADGRIGVDRAALTFLAAPGRHLPGVDVADGDAVTQTARLVKAPDDLACIEEACAIGGRGDPAGAR